MMKEAPSREDWQAQDPTPETMDLLTSDIIIIKADVLLLLKAVI